METHVVLCTCPTADVGASIGGALVTEALAACVNIIPGVRSIYVWEGQVHDDQEVLLVIKTTDTRLLALRERIAALHPYQCPEIIAFPIVFGHAPYLDWVKAQTTPPPAVG